MPACTLALLVWSYQPSFTPSPPRQSSASAQAVESAYQRHQSGVGVEVKGRVERLLPDDRSGSRRQRFVLRLPSNHPVLIVHNLDMAERVPVAPGDIITVHGRYEYSARGGTIHQTHRDPRGDGPGGWIRLRGTAYR